MATGAPLQTSGFSNVAHDSQSTFRAVLGAMAEPGRIFKLASIPSPPDGLSPAAAAVLLALADFETALWLAQPDDAVASYLSFETGARVVFRPSEATFAYIAQPALMPPFDAFALGEPAYPDRSTTLVLALERLEGGGSLELSGPGIPSSIRLDVAPLPDDFLQRMADNRARFPLGVDLILTAGDRVACLPRSVIVA